MDPGTAIAVGQVSGKILSIIWKYYSEVKDARDKIVYLANEIQDLQLVMQKLQELIKKDPTTEKLPTSASLDKTIGQSLLDMKKLESKLTPGTGDKAMKKFGKRALKWPLAAKETDEWMARMQRLKGTLNLALSTDQSSLIADVDANVAQLKLSQEATEQERQLGKLPVAVAAAFNSYHRQYESQCATDTRKELLAQLRVWGKSHQRPIFWLSGMAGTGKSTISRTFATDLKARRTLAGSFFFSKSSGEANNAMNFVGTLACHLANEFPPVRECICEAISLHSEVLQQGLRNQWDEFILGPLSKLQLTPRPVWNFVIDALDECDSDNDIRLLLQLLVEIKSLATVDLGVFITSRPEIAIRLGFKAMPDMIHQNLDLRDVPRAMVEHDIMVLLKREFGRISAQNKLDNWPNEDELRLLVRNADGLFIYATTVCRFVEDPDWDPEERLSMVLGNESTGGATEYLDNMYTQVLKSALIKGRGEEDAAKLCKRFTQIVGSIVVLSDELSIWSLSKLLSIPIRSVEKSLDSLHSLLDIQEDPRAPVRLLHPSFRDFLVNENRCKDSRFLVEETVTHAMLAMRCLEILSVSLKRNICELPTPGASPQDVQRDFVREQLPEHVQYACQYWVYHFSATSSEFKTHVAADDESNFRNFLHKDLLHWLEAMSLMGRMSQAVLMVSRLANMTELESNHNVFAMIKDAEKFILTYRYIIQKAPLQTYESALVFSPTNSLVRKCYTAQFPSWLTLLPESRENWSSSMFVLQGHEKDVTQLAFSPDGKYLASSSLDRTVMIWDLATRALQVTLKGHYSPVIAIAFSSDRSLKSASEDGTVYFWDYMTGENQQTIHLEMDESYTLNKLLFLPEAKVAVEWWVGNYFRVGIWSLKQGRMLTQILPEFEFERGCLKDASIGGLLAVEASQRDGAVEVMLYDSITGLIAYACRFAVESFRIEAIALSSEGQLAVRRSDGVLELHDPFENCIRHFQTQQHYVYALAFSPDGNMIVSASQEGITNLWYLSSLQSVTMERWANPPGCPVFSPDGKHIAYSQEYPPVVRLCSASPGPSEEEDTDQNISLHYVIFSPAGDQIAASYSDGNIKLYDASGGALRLVLVDDSQDCSYKMTFSNKSNLLAVHLRGRIALFSTRNGFLLNVLSIVSSERLDTWEGRLIFSSDDKQIASNTVQKVVPIWDPVTGQLLQQLEVYEQRVVDIVISLSGREIASTWSDQMARVWDTKTGQLLYKLEGVKIREYSICEGPVAIAFSPDGRSLAYQAPSGCVCIHDWQANESLAELESVGSNDVERLVFSNNGRLLACTFYDRSSTLWDVRTTRHIKTIQGVYVHDMSFPADDSYLNTSSGCFKLGEPLGRHRNYWNKESGSEWIKEGDRKMLWLPPDLRHFMAYHDGLFLLRDSSRSKLHFLRFTQDEVITEVSD